MSGEQIVKLLMRGSELPPLPMRKVGADRFECTVQLKLIYEHPPHDPARTIGKDSRPVLLGPNGRTVELEGLTAIVLAPGDTLYLTATLTRDNFHKLGLQP